MITKIIGIKFQKVQPKEVILKIMTLNNIPIYHRKLQMMDLDSVF